MRKPGFTCRLTAMLLCGCLLAGCGAKASPEERALPTPSPAPEAVPAVSVEQSAPEAAVKPVTRSDGVHADVDFKDLTWHVGDLTAFNALAEKLTVSRDGEEAKALYQQMLDEYMQMRTDAELAWIDFYASAGTDAAASQACQQLDELLTQAGDTLFTAASAAMKGGGGESLAEYVGEKLAEELTDYDPMTDRESQLWARETELEIRYNELESRTDLGLRELNRQLGDIFLEMIRVRTELAQIGEYDTYAEYAYKEVYGRDYTPGDAAALCQAVKPFARRFFQNCSYNGALYEDYGQFSAGELMDLLRTYAPRISPDAARAQRYMEEHGMYLLESSDKVSSLGFTTSLAMYNAPFLFNALYGSVHDVGSTFHEFGHYYDAFMNTGPGVLMQKGSYDIFEIHSTSMEALLYGWYDEIFASNADWARIYCLYGLIDNVISGCIYDEFLQYTYAHPDLQVEEINKAYMDIASSYGQSFHYASDVCYWIFVNHNFISPFYYISYSASALASLQIWAMAEHDREGAIALYNDLISRGAYGPGYFELMDQVGLKRFTDDLDGCLQEACQTLEELCRQYNSGRAAA